MNLFLPVFAALLSLILASQPTIRYHERFDPISPGDLNLDTDNSPLDYTSGFA